MMQPSLDAVQRASPGAKGASQMRLDPVAGQIFIRAARSLNGAAPGSGKPARHPLAEVPGCVVQLKALDLRLHKVVRDGAHTRHQVIGQEYPRLAVKLGVCLPPADPVGSGVEVADDLVAELNRCRQVQAKRARQPEQAVLIGPRLRRIRLRQAGDILVQHEASFLGGICFRNSINMPGTFRISIQTALGLDRVGVLSIIGRTRMLGVFRNRPLRHAT